VKVIGADSKVVRLSNERRMAGATENARPDIARLDNAAPDQTVVLEHCSHKRITCKSRLSRFDSGAYSRLQFLRAVSHSVGAHTESTAGRQQKQQQQQRGRRRVPAAPTSRASESATAAAATTSDDCCEVCLVVSRAGFALVLCGHARFCEACAMRVPVMDEGN